MSQPQRVPAELDEIVDRVLGYDPESKASRANPEGRAEVEAWLVPISDIFAGDDLRLDAAHFNPTTTGVIGELQKSGHELSPLSKWARVELRGQFTRIWAQDQANGVPYFNATDMLSLLALGVPAGGPRYLSHATDTDIDALIVREGWLLMTCSGTIGRMFYVPKRLDGWAATHDFIRIIPNQPDVAGYLYAWLSSSQAQSQILSFTHGGQIDHVTDDQVGGVLVPKIADIEIGKINESVMKALKAREKAIESLANSWGGNEQG
jgi:type I restriction enzyme S subunit